MKKLFCIFFLFSLTLQLTAQTKQKPAELFKDAEYYRMYEEYIEALPLYKQLLDRGYNNAHINYRIGECYLNISGQKELAIPYFEKAVKNMDDNFREGAFREEQAPVYALFYLGRAYQINNQLDTALNTYNRFVKSIKNERNYNMGFVKKQIQSCKRAREFLNDPIPVYQVNLGKTVNNDFSNLKPVVDSAENRLIYTSELQFYDAVFMAEKNAEEWENPINLAPQIKSEGDIYPSSMNPAGDKMVLFQAQRYQGNLYISDFNKETGEWKQPRKLNEPVNTKFWETHGSLGPDNKTLYFTSNRKDGHGGLDIYVSRYNESKNQWTEPLNLGEQINTPYHEETPFITADGKRLYFSSQGHEGIGGFDVFYSDKIGENEWSKPVNIGYPISTTDDDLFFCPVEHGHAGYMAKSENSGYGNEDIYRIEIYSEDNPKLIRLKGQINLARRLRGISSEDFSVNIDSLNGASIQSLTPGEDSLSYAFTLTPGKYQLTYRGEGYGTIKEKISFTYDYPRESYNLDVTLNPTKTLSRSEFISLPDIFFPFDQYALEDQERKKLDTVARTLKNHPDVNVVLTGHTDAIGNEDYNRKLSERRARSVMKYLVEKGIDSTRMELEAKGENYPVALNTYQDGKDCPEGREYNRRVEVNPFSNKTKRVVGNLQMVPNELRKKKGLYYTVLLSRRDNKLPQDYFDQFPSLEDYSIEMFRNGEYIYTMGKFENQAQAIDSYQQVVNLNFNEARIISSYQLSEMLKMDAGR